MGLCPMLAVRAWARGPCHSEASRYAAFDRGLLPHPCTVRGAQDQFQYGPALLDTVDGPTTLRETFREMLQLRFEGLHRRKILPPRFGLSTLEMIERILGTEDLPLVADDMNLVRAVR